MTKTWVYVVEEEGGIDLPNGEQTEERWVLRAKQVELQPLRIRLSDGETIALGGPLGRVVAVGEP